MDEFVAGEGSSGPRWGGFGAARLETGEPQVLVLVLYYVLQYSPYYRGPYGAASFSIHAVE